MGEKGGVKMRRLIEKLENTFAAITFAEAGEVETAREILEEEEYTKTFVTLLLRRAE